MNTQYAKLETRDLEQVKQFMDATAPKLGAAELTIRRSAGGFTTELRPTDEPSS